MNQQEPSTETSGLGERRRRREAERAARLAAEKAGQAQPLTRRELRRRQLEEQARLEAIATGELPLVDEEGRPLGPEAAAQAASAQALTTAEPRLAQPPAPVAADRVHGPDERAGQRGTQAAEPVVGPSPRTPGRAGAPEPRAPEPAGAPEPRAAERAVATARSRRSMRERLQDAPAGPEEAPGERTATTRRPVVRAPHTAKGVRSLDSTGALTGVQPVQAPAAPPRPAPAAPEAPVTTDPAGWAAAAAFPAPRFPSVPDDSTIVIDAVPAPAGGPREAAASAGTTTTPASAASGRSAGTTSTPASAASPRSAMSPRSAATPGTVPAAPAAPESHEAPAPEPGPGPVFAPVRRQPTEAERARSAASPARFPSAVSGPEAVAAAALDGDGETDQDDYQEARPQWASLAEFSAATSDSPDEPGEGTSRGEPARRSVRDRMAGDGGTVSAGSAEDAEERTRYVDEVETRNPAVSLVKIVALVLAAVVIGLLIGLLVFNQGDDGASVRIQSLAPAAAAAVGLNP